MILKSHRKAKNLVEPNNFEKANKRKKKSENKTQSWKTHLPNFKAE